MQDKNELLKRIQAAIEREAHVEWQTSAIGLSDGTVTLEGEVAHVATKKRAVKAATGVAGVEQVHDRLRVAAGPAQGDAAIRDAVCRLLLREIDFRNCGFAARIKGQREILRDAGAQASGSIEVAVSDSVVTLAGQVISLSHKRLAGVLAWWALGCCDVVNALQVVPAELDNDDEIVEAMHLVLETDPLVRAERIGIGSRDGVVTLEGVVGSQGEKTRAEMDAWCLFAVDDVINRLEVK